MYCIKMSVTQKAVCNCEIKSILTYLLTYQRMYTSGLFVSAQLPLLKLCYHIHRTQQLIELHNASGCMKYTSDIHQHRWTVVAKQLIEVDDHHLRQRAHSRAVWFV